MDVEFRGVLITNEIKAFANMLFANEITPHEVVRIISKKKCEVRKMGTTFHYIKENPSASYWSYYQNEDNQIFTIRLNYKNNWIRVGGFSNTHFFMMDEPIYESIDQYKEEFKINY